MEKIIQKNKDGILKLDNGLSKTTSDNKDIVSFNNIKLLDISYNEYNEKKIKINFYKKYSIISPKIDTIKNSYEINYYNAPLKEKEILEHKYIIIKTQGFFLLFKLDFSNCYTLTNDIKNKYGIEIKYVNNQYFNIKLSLFNDSYDLYKTISNFKKIIPLWGYNIGILVDYYKNNVMFSEIIKIFKKNISYIIINNSPVIEELNNYKINNINNYLEKLILNDLKYIFQYDNTISKESNKNNQVLKYRNGNHVIFNNKQYLDYFNNESKDFLFKVYSKILEKKSNGIYLNSSYPVINNEEEYNKITCKGDREILTYSNNIKKGVSILNNLIDRLNDNENENMYFSNILSDDFINTFFLMEYNGALKKIITKICHIYKQGYINFGIIFKQTNFNLLSKISYKKLIILLLPIPVVFDIEIINDIINKNNKAKELLPDILKIRSQFLTLFDNIIYNFKNHGILPVTSYSYQDNISGLILGESIYIAFITDRLLDSIISLPRGKWYSISDYIIIKGEGNFIQQSNNKLFHFFLKSGSIIPINNSTSYSNKIKFMIYPEYLKDEKNNITINKIKSRILERVDAENMIIHDFKLSSKANEIIINYSFKSKIDINNMISFHIIIEDLNIINIKLNNKKIFFKKYKNKQYLEFEISNKTNNNNIVIHYSI